MTYIYVLSVITYNTLVYKYVPFIYVSFMTFIIFRLHKFKTFKICHKIEAKDLQSVGIIW